MQRSPLAPERFPDLPPLAGVRLATRACEIRYKARSDVCLIELAPGTSVAG
ncbi:MAG: bifunctional ornithine acetyltransferase/N-acetylglutamate synthase, partial [Proteobacteria bacterium]|nr:bifunctional ornithine acetyltransferase/N-acetylglutamate synthase [Pseudomonadota bacterium]